jgi:hypothetical protein
MQGGYPQTQEVIPLSSVIYEEMDALYLLKGMGSPSGARPWTVTEIMVMLDRIDPFGLNRVERRLYDHITSDASKPLRLGLDKHTRLDVNLELTFEAYTHTNSTEYVLDTDWIYGYEARKPMALLSLELAVGSFMYIYTDLQYGRNRFLEADLRRDLGALPDGVGAVIPPASTAEVSFPIRSWAYSKPVLTNFILQTRDFDFSWPKRAIMSVGGKHWNLSLARDKVHWGNGHSGNFVIDDQVDFNDFARYSVFTGRFRYEWLNVFFPMPYTNNGDETFKILMAHRLEFRILKSLTFAISENVMYQDNAFNVRYVNPAFIFHNLNDRSLFNAIAQIELDFTFLPGFNLYTQWVIDQAKAPNEDTSQSDAYGFLVGIEHARGLGPGVLTSSLEGAYTTPLLYRRDIVDFLSVRTYDVIGAGEHVHFDYIGYPFGGDALVLQLDTAYLLPGVGSISARFLGMLHGKMHFFVSHNDEGKNTQKANLDASTPSGREDEQELTFAASLRGNYLIPPVVSWLAISTWAQLDVVVKHNKLMYSESGIGEALLYHKPGIATDLQFTIGVGLKL